MPQQLKSWSYSRYSTYKECPAKAKYKYLDKLPEPPAPAMERGNAIHKLAEQYAKGELKKLPQELIRFKDEFAELKASKPFVENDWVFKQDWSQTVWNDWTGAWCRVKIDAACLDGSDLYIIDHKTGKLRTGYDEQLSLYAATATLVHPHVRNISTQMWFLDSGDVVEKSYSASEGKALLKGWEKKVKPMLNDTAFKPTPSADACRFCSFSKKKGGPCKF